MPVFCPAEFLPALQKRHALSDQRHRDHQLLPLDAQLTHFIFAAVLHLIPARRIVVAFNIVDALSRLLVNLIHFLIQRIGTQGRHHIMRLI